MLEKVLKKKMTAKINLAVYKYFYKKKKETRMQVDNRPKTQSNKPINLGLAHSTPRVTRWRAK